MTFSPLNQTKDVFLSAFSAVHTKVMEAFGFNPAVGDFIVGGSGNLYTMKTN